MRVAGVDEAGRGCAIGPLVIAGALFDQETLQTLTDIGVKDSKKLSRKKRESLEPEIKKLAVDYQYFELTPKTIDTVVFRSVPLRRLNYLETMAMAKIVRDLHPDEAHIDTCDVDSQRVADQIRSVISFKIDIKCEPRADDIYPSTSAASILAKVKRDNIIEMLHEKYGDFNSGYASDPITQRYISDWFNDNQECPVFMRASWATIRRHMKPFKQLKL